MSALELEVQPVQVAEILDMEEPFEDAVPDVKSGVRVDPNAAMQSARFRKTDVVHMSQISNGVRTKGVFTVYKAQYNVRGGYVEYQLIDYLTGGMHKNGAWIREKDLKLERRG
ncbi:hypothetical protein P153DRAFT_385121 [Dothidotthia symphoricarpi CBS 119687]|uniref:Uncharacterized protein n=1 Tax=Dothidotthia symphoricarpi CBS 119687 TaxID=1392245 RepID=A0A6A6ADH7_9PLEO|nr:uncharacterized protein P153DRAFT_385121 [Dothidotthia symphoricarpi CBS 119687]KAF2129889.1 hypothetical protein P153DRAFT_385121 [Dothidotthia symphoricarpi CBS 119687]